MLFKFQQDESNKIIVKLRATLSITFDLNNRNVATYSVEQQLVYVGNEAGKLFTIRELFKKV